MRAVGPGTFRRQETKFVQGWLNTFMGEELSVDGRYGPKTTTAVKRFQVLKGLQADGKAGPVTQAKMGFLKHRNTNIVALHIPFYLIEQANVLLRNGQAYSCKRFADEGKWDIVWNGAFFERATLKICQFVSLAGRVQSYGMADIGIAYPNGLGAPEPRTRHESIGKPFDMQAGAPILLQEYKPRTDLTGFTVGMMASKTRRNCTGLTHTGIALMFSINGVSLYEMQAEGMYIGLRFLQGNDGGGSQSLFMGGAYVLTTDGRSIPAAVGLRIRR